MSLEFANIDNYKKQVETLFVSAFPREERPPLWVMIRRSRQGRAELRAVLDDGRFVGMIFVVGNSEVKTLMFLAVADDMQNSGYGTRILQAVHRKYSDVKLFLNIEPLDETADNYEQRCRRKRFYERNGMELLDYQVREAGVTYEMMTFGEYVTKEEYEGVMQVMYGRLLYKIIKRM